MSTSVMGLVDTPIKSVIIYIGTSLGASGGWVWGFLAGNTSLALLSSAKI